jgi:Holliday junction resolvase
MPNPDKRKGDRIERQIVSLLTQSGIRACKMSRCGHAGGDIYLEPAAGGKRGMVAEVKARKEPIAKSPKCLCHGAHSSC